MSTDRTQVVVTGLCAITPLGGDVASTWAAMLAGTSGVRRLSDDWAPEPPVRIAAPAAVDPAPMLRRTELRHLDRCQQLALVAAGQAWRDAGSPPVEPERLGVSVATGIGGLGSTIEAYETLCLKGWQRLSPFTVPILMPNGAAAWIAVEFGARAGTHTPVSACAGVVVLESESHATRRGTAVHAVAAGVGYSADAFHPTQPNPDGSGAAGVGHQVDDRLRENTDTARSSPPDLLRDHGAEPSTSSRRRCRAGLPPLAPLAEILNRTIRAGRKSIEGCMGPCRCA